MKLESWALYHCVAHYRTCSDKILQKHPTYTKVGLLLAESHFWTTNCWQPLDLVDKILQKHPAYTKVGLLLAESHFWTTNCWQPLDLVFCEWYGLDACCSLYLQPKQGNFISEISPNSLRKPSVIFGKSYPQSGIYTTTIFGKPFKDHLGQIYQLEYFHQ